MTYFSQSMLSPSLLSSLPLFLSFVCFSDTRKVKRSFHQLCYDGIIIWVFIIFLFYLLLCMCGRPLGASICTTEFSLCFFSFTWLICTLPQASWVVRSVLETCVEMGVKWLTSTPIHSNYYNSLSFFLSYIILTYQNNNFRCRFSFSFSHLGWGRGLGGRGWVDQHTAQSTREREREREKLKNCVEKSVNEWMSEWAFTSCLFREGCCHCPWSKSLTLLSAQHLKRECCISTLSTTLSLPHSTLRALFQFWVVSIPLPFYSFF